MPWQRMTPEIPNCSSQTRFSYMSYSRQYFRKLTYVCEVDELDTDARNKRQQLKITCSCISPSAKERTVIPAAATVLMALKLRVNQETPEQEPKQVMSILGVSSLSSQSLLTLKTYAKLLMFHIVQNIRFNCFNFDSRLAVLSVSVRVGTLNTVDNI